MKSGTLACLIGTLLLGAAIGIALASPKRRGRRGDTPPVEQLAETLEQAWAPYHSR